MALTAEQPESSAPSRESYNQLFLTIFVSRPILVVELNQTIWSFQKKRIDYGFENEEGMRIFLLGAPNIFG